MHRYGGTASSIPGGLRPYLVMDYLPGGTFTARLQQDGPLSAGS